MKTIYIISEDYIFLKLFETPILKRIPDSRIVFCNSFNEVKTKVIVDDCNFVIADGVMSGVASYEIIHYLRTEKKISVPIFFISEVNIAYFCEKAIESGVSVCYSKPFNPYEIIEDIAKIIK